MCDQIDKGVEGERSENRRKAEDRRRKENKNSLPLLPRQVIYESVASFFGTTGIGYFPVAHVSQTTLLPI
ncbi:MAG: hypothetical protein ACQEW9_16865 [Bacteroidota bacterium]